jgi:hypothetical protein
MNPTDELLDKAAAAIANARGMRRGLPEIIGIMDALPEKLRDEVRDDAKAALAAIDAPASASIAGGPWLVWSHEHSAWWRPGWHGYTTRVRDAGRYEYAEARKICDGACFPQWSANQGIKAPNEVMVPAPEMLAAIDAEVTTS